MQKSSAVCIASEWIWQWTSSPVFFFFFFCLPCSWIREKITGACWVGDGSTELLLLIVLYCVCRVILVFIRKKNTSKHIDYNSRLQRPHFYRSLSSAPLFLQIFFLPSKVHNLTHTKALKVWDPQQEQIPCVPYRLNVPSGHGCDGA